MDYFFCKKDSNDFIHSIDNLILTYFVENVGLKCIDDFIEDIHAIRDKHIKDISYYEKLGINACRKYAFYQNFIHLDDGIVLSIGHYDDYNKENKELYVFPMLRLEVNPNKHCDKPIFEDLLKLIKDKCYGCTIDRYDYAIDVPTEINNVVVMGSRKEKGLYKGTRYYGQRNKNGFCRIYDKAKEQGLEEPLTRIEHVVSTTKGTKKLSFEKIYLKDKSYDISSDLGKTDTVLVELSQLCLFNGLEIDTILNKLEKRKKREIKKYINGNGLKEFVYEKDIHDELLRQVSLFFDIQEKEQVTSEWLTVDENIELLFD